MKKILTLCLMLCCGMIGMAQEYQWSVPLKDYISDETSREPEAFLWIPPQCNQLKSIIFSQQNMSEETLFDMPSFRDALAKMDMGIIWITPPLNYPWDVNQGVQPIFNDMLKDLADISGYDEIEAIPLVPMGHSAMATFPWNFAAWNPERTLAVISLHGDAPRTNLTGYGRENLEWGRTRNIDGIPGLMIEGEYEWWEARVNPALAFRMMYPESCISFLCDAGRGHFDLSEETAAYIALFLEKAMQQRISAVESSATGDVSLKKINPKDGWMAKRWIRGEKKRPKAAPFNQYKGNIHDSFWYFDGEMAQLTENRYARSLGKKDQYISFIQNGKLLQYNADRHVAIQPPFQPENDGITFHLKAVFTDSLYQNLSSEHVASIPRITKVCGPVKVINDTTFRVDFFRMGMDNRRRTGGISLVADVPGDKHYNSAVQHIGISVPFRNSDGKTQQIDFPAMNDINASTNSITLNATSDAGLPVSFYVKEGPAYVEGNQLIFTSIPPRAKYPLKITIVAWQYGVAGLMQTAEPVERSFYLIKE